MKNTLKFVLAVCACTLFAQQNPRPAGPVDTDKFKTQYVRLGAGGDEALLYEPLTMGPNSRIALIYSHPDGNTFNFLPAWEMAKRGYRFMTVNHHADWPSMNVASFVQSIYSE